MTKFGVINETFRVEVIEYNKKVEIDAVDNG